MRLVKEAPPDLILMDLSIPVIDGWECARRLKADPLTRTSQIIALTAHAMRGDEERALAAGCGKTQGRAGEGLGLGGG